MSAGIVVDLFADGKVLPQLQEVKSPLLFLFSSFVIILYVFLPWLAFRVYSFSVLYMSRAPFTTQQNHIVVWSP